MVLVFPFSLRLARSLITGLSYLVLFFAPFLSFFLPYYTDLKGRRGRRENVEVLLLHTFLFLFFENKKGKKGKERNNKRKELSESVVD